MPSYQLTVSLSDRTLCGYCRQPIPRGSLEWCIGYFGFKSAKRVIVCPPCIVEMVKRIDAGKLENFIEERKRVVERNKVLKVAKVL